MPYRKQKFINGEIYHIVLRGVNGNLIFKNTNDYYRLIFSIYEFNNLTPVNIWIRRKQRIIEKTGREKVPRQRDLLVEILAFCVMPNHIHLLVRQVKENGITIFMRKLGTGYAGYFNRKYDHKGYVFQNRFQSIHIKDNNQLLTVFNYIHTNPISLIEKKLKEKGIRKLEKIIKFLEEYRWSSYLDYINIKNFSSVTERNFMLKIIGGEKGCRDFVKNWIVHKTEMSKFFELFLE